MDIPDKHPKTFSLETIAAFSKLVPSAVIDVRNSTATFPKGKVRIKRALKIANQVQVWRGEPIALHIPGQGWYVLPLSWQIKRALDVDAKKQHASHAYECMMIPVGDIPQAFKVTSANLTGACLRAIADASYFRQKLQNVSEAMRRTLTSIFQEALG